MILIYLLLKTAQKFNLLHENNVVIICNQRLQQLDASHPLQNSNHHSPNMQHRMQFLLALRFLVTARLFHYELHCVFHGPHNKAEIFWNFNNCIIIEFYLNFKTYKNLQHLPFWYESLKEQHN